jgi:hypothetical protein
MTFVLASGQQMGRFFFHIRDGESVVSDEEGMELPNRMAVDEEAQFSVIDIARQCMNARKPTSRLKIEIEDESGAVIGSRSVRDALH